MQKLSDMTVRTLPVPERGQKLYYDRSLPSFGCRVSQGGTKSFFLQLGVNRRFVTIGRYPIISLSKARDEAKKLLAEKTLGKVRPQTITFPQAREMFITEKRAAKKPRTAKEYERLLTRFTFKDRLADMRHDDFVRTLNRFKSPSERTHLLTAAKVFFNWCIKRRYMTDNPAFGITGHKSPSRDRVLTDDEIRLIWQTATGSFGDYVRLLLLLGQRRGELRQGVPTDTTLVINAQAFKTNRDHVIPFSPLARSLWRPFPKFAWSREKRKLDLETTVTGYCLHDCRRTFASLHQRIGTPVHLVEKLLGHTSGTFGGIVSVYQKHQYLDEMAEAQSRYEREIQRIVGP